MHDSLDRLAVRAHDLLVALLDDSETFVDHGVDTVPVQELYSDGYSEYQWTAVVHDKVLSSMFAGTEEEELWKHAFEPAVTGLFNDLVRVANDEAGGPVKFMSAIVDYGPRGVTVQSGQRLITSEGSGLRVIMRYSIHAGMQFVFIIPYRFDVPNRKVAA